MKLFENLKDSFGIRKSHKRIKNTTPLVQFDKNGNIIKRNTESQTSNQEGNYQNHKREIDKNLDSTRQSQIQQEKIEKKKRDDETYISEEPYEFPDDIINAIKRKINRIIDLITGIDYYGNEIKKTKTKKQNPKPKKAEWIKRNTRVGKAIGEIYDSYSNTKERFMSLSKKARTFVIITTLVLMLAIIIGIFQIWFSGYRDTSKSIRISDEQKIELISMMDKKYPDKRSDDLKPLPYKTTPANLDVKAGAAILVDASNGCVLYEKNADREIPPASLTKLFVMYIVFQEVEKGRISLDDIVELPELSWAVNQPKDASLMHLGQGQSVTLRELLQGLAVASGNDAAKAVAYYVSGTQDKFIERMNEECKKLGLTKTRFVEPSGYDEHNMTTARELAKFARIYITRYPESLSDYHSLKYIDYPKKENLPSWKKDFGDSLAVHQTNTNPLLGRMAGVDGIKTGFIYESGYNLALTVKRGEQRFLSITLQGKGKGTKAGNEGRIHDGTEMMEWAFEAFADYIPESKHELAFPVPSLASKNNRGKFVNLVPAWTTAIPVPHVVGETARDSANAVKYSVEIPSYIYGNVQKGEVYGYITYKLGEITLEKVPLVADRTLEESGLWGKFWGTLAKLKLNAE